MKVYNEHTGMQILTVKVSSGAVLSQDLSLYIEIGLWTVPLSQISEDFRQASVTCGVSTFCPGFLSP